VRAAIKLQNIAAAVRKATLTRIGAWAADERSAYDVPALQGYRMRRMRTIAAGLCAMLMIAAVQMSAFFAPAVFDNRGDTAEAAGLSGQTETAPDPVERPAEAAREHTQAETLLLTPPADDETELLSMIESTLADRSAWTEETVRFIQEFIDGYEPVAETSAFTPETEQVYETEPSGIVALSAEDGSISGEVIVIEPVTEVIAVGTRELSAVISDDSFIWPTDGIVTSWFGPRAATYGSTNHKGIDICASYGQSICAAQSGEVIFSGWDSGFGYVVRIGHDNGSITVYAHCSKLLVSTGEQVARGQEISQMGSTGTASGVHLHFELIIDGENVDPLPHLP